MRLKIIRAGIFDSIQDLGRFGYQAYGINPSGAMDAMACRLANLLVGNDENEAVIEMHFPASTFLFEQPATIALTGANFKATVNDEYIPLNKAVFINEFSVLQFTHRMKGARCYLAVAGGFEITKWLHSYSTNFKAQAGGFNGRRLLKDDVMLFKGNYNESYLINLQLKNIRDTNTKEGEILVLPGNEWNWLSEEFQFGFLTNEYNITTQSDRMGYRLSGNAIYPMKKEELVSSPVCFGTVQLLPDGQLILLMADHQTTGGYPRIAYVISAYHSVVAQMNPGETIRFALTDINTAENLYIEHLKKFAEII